MRNTKLEELAGNLPDHPYEAIKQLCVLIKECDKEIGPMDMKVMQSDFYLDAFGFLQALLEAHSMRNAPQTPTGSKPDIVRQVLGAVNDFEQIADRQLEKEESIRKVEQAKESYAAKIGGVFMYEFNDDDLARIQRALNDLRQLINRSKEIEAKHKRRLLKRLERLQQELHKKVSDLDHFWGLIGDGSTVMRKIGEDAKPIIDRIREVLEIIWKAQSMAEGLPEGMFPPLLNPPKEE